jgi:hypothetical protein
MSVVIGAEILRRIAHAGRWWEPGEVMKRDEWMLIPAHVQRTLEEADLVRVLHGLEQQQPARREGSLRRIVVQARGGMFDVIEGHAITSSPVTRQQAEALARGERSAA